MAKLFSPITLRELTLKNRIMMAPMCMYSADVRGYAQDWHFTHYTSRAVGGTGLIMVEATGVEPRGRISERDLGIWEDGHMAGLKRITDGIRSFGGKTGIQLAHAGRKSETTGEPIVAPSPLPFSGDYRTPVELDDKEIGRVINSFAQAARRADEAGFDVIEIHGAHGYLISEFLSPLTNKRTDAYGGDEEGRARFLKEVIEAVRKVWPREKPVFLRVSAEDYAEGGNRPDALGRMIAAVKGLGIDMVNVSSGGVVEAAPKAYPGYQIPMASEIKTMTGLPVVAGGMITEAALAEEILQNGRADMVFLGRELLRNPYWPLQAAKELRGEIEWPFQYERGKR